MRFVYMGSFFIMTPIVLWEKFWNKVNDLVDAMCGTLTLLFILLYHTSRVLTYTAIKITISELTFVAAVIICF